MKTKFLLLALLAVAFVLQCASPSDPFENPNMVRIEQLSSLHEQEYSVGDSIKIIYEVDLPHLLDSIVFSFEDKRIVLECDYERAKTDTIEVGISIEQPGNYEIIITAILKDGSEREAGSIRVIIDGPVRDDQDVYWTQGSYRDTLYEGEVLKLQLDNLLSNEGNKAVEFTMLDDQERVEIEDKILSFDAAVRDSGLYLFSVELTSGEEYDTLMFILRVDPKYHTLLTLDSEDSGSVIIEPQREAYRLGDTVVVRAVPEDGYSFFAWREGVMGYHDEMYIIVTEDLQISALFREGESRGCILVDGGSINEFMKTYAPQSMRPQMLCLEPVMYEDDRIRISGNVRIVIQ
ncbi:hypothetical protein QA601_18110 [Chitinispirillales bacterium ANBcel5]|uniref:InlB B-repeat-containing protein n=1 Tax=Cellulosispirillum alkaliphilum TaxID=3039283 RepID=UPI002A54A644|nr:hypothetical protein [Chitinispirillales bacterium ANBcel5]